MVKFGRECLDNILIGLLLDLPLSLRSNNNLNFLVAGLLTIFFLLLGVLGFCVLLFLLHLVFDLQILLVFDREDLSLFLLLLDPQVDLLTLFDGLVDNLVRLDHFCSLLGSADFSHFVDAASDLV